jgi:lipopolysaccharide export system protein LptA
VRFTIERIRTLVLIAAVLLLAALAVFLARAKFKNVLSRRDLPQRLGLNITEESNGYSYSHNLGAHSKFRIHASKAIQLKNDRIELHGVEIEIFGADGIQSDKIAGDEFEYDQKSGIASAQGPVEMMLSRPAAAKTSDIRKTDRSHTTAAAASQASQIQVKTSGVSFDRNTGVVTTTQRVDFSTTQGTGSAVGASFDSQNGYLRLMQSVELSTYRGADPVKIHADHAEFDRDAQLCLLNTATLAYRGGEAEAAQARILFRDDGSAARLDATGGFTLTTATGGRLASPRAAMEFSEKNQLRHGHLEGGVTFDSKQEGGSAKEGRTIDGTSPTAELDFSTEGQLRHAHLERGVTMQSDETSLDSAGQTLRVARTWRSPVADLDFHSVQSGGKTQLEAQSIHGTGGVTITSDSQRGDTAAVPAKMQADEMTGTFGAESVLRTIAGTGHAVMEQTTAAGAHQIASGERLAVVLSPPHGAVGTKTLSRTQSAADPDVQSAELDGHVVLFEQPAPKPGTQTQPPLRAAAGKAVYEGAGEWLHLTANPRIVNGGLELTAEKVDLSRQSGDAFAHNNVKATWLGETPNGGSPNGNSNQSGALQGISALGGNGPAHVIANEAQLNESTGEATFRGHARLWQQANSVAGPEIVLNQHLQTLVARTADANDPVRAVLLSAGAPGAGSAHGQAATENTAAGTTAPSVIRIRGGDLWYSGAEHRAVMHGGVAGAVTAETGTAMSTSDTVELRLIPAGNHDASTSQAQVDRMTASGHVVLVSRGRRGTGGQLVYSGVTGDYVLTGTRAAPPRMTDPEQGNVTGEALIFHSRDDSVSIEGGGQDTRTETTAPREHAR